MKIKENLLQILIVFFILINLFRTPLPYRTKIDESMAENLLREAYKPLEDFIKSATPVEGKELLLLPSNINNKDDFIKSFDNRVDGRVLEDFFESLVVERGGVLYIDETIYIPNIYSENGQVTNHYIRKYTRTLYSILSASNEKQEEELLITEKWKVSGNWNKRKNYFERNKEGDWVLNHISGTTMFGFVEASDNPWNNEYNNIH